MNTLKICITGVLAMTFGCGPSLENQRGQTLAPKNERFETATSTGLRLSTPEDIEIKEYDEELWEKLVSDYRRERDVIARCGSESLPVLRASKRHLREIWEEQGEGTVWSLTLKVYTRDFYIENIEKLQGEYRDYEATLVDLEMRIEEADDANQRDEYVAKYESAKQHLESLSEEIAMLREKNDDNVGEKEVTYVFPAACKEVVIQLRDLSVGASYAVGAALMQDMCPVYAGGTDKFRFEGKTLDLKMLMTEIQGCSHDEGVVNIRTVY